MAPTLMKRVLVTKTVKDPETNETEAEGGAFTEAVVDEAAVVVEAVDVLAAGATRGRIQRPVAPQKIQSLRKIISARNNSFRLW